MTVLQHQANESISTILFTYSCADFLNRILLLDLYVACVYKHPEITTCQLSVVDHNNQNA